LGAGCFNALRRRADVLNIGEVACPPRSKFRGDKIVLRNKEHLEAAFRVNDASNAPFPCRVKIDARNIGQNINRARVVSEAKKAAAVGKILPADILERCAKPGKRRICRLRVGRVAFMNRSMSFVARGCA
jgi:hypothetical protein